MITNDELDSMTHERRLAWLGGLSEEESLIVHTPDGHRQSLAIAAYFKHELMTVEMDAGHRLKLLEGLNNLVHDGFTAEALAVIKPACPIQMSMIRETFAVGEMRKAFALLGSLEVFSHLAQLNPSLIDAIRICWPAKR